MPPTGRGKWGRRGIQHCLQDTTLTGLKIATPNWVFKFSNIISQQIDKFSFAPSLCANFSASNWVISLQSARYICVFAQSCLLGVALTFIACWLTANRITLNNLQHLILFKPLQSFFAFLFTALWHVACGTQIILHNKRDNSARSDTCQPWPPCCCCCSLKPFSCCCRVLRCRCTSIKLKANFYANWVLSKLKPCLALIVTDRILWPA